MTKFALEPFTPDQHEKAFRDAYKQVRDLLEDGRKAATDPDAPIAYSRGERGAVQGVLAYLLALLALHKQRYDQMAKRIDALCDENEQLLSMLAEVDTKAAFHKHAADNDANWRNRFNGEAS